MELGKVIRSLRNKQKMSQQEVADMVGICQSTYCAWESDRSLPNMKYYAPLARVLRIEPEQLFPINIPAENPTKEPINQKINTNFFPERDLIECLKETILLQNQIIDYLKKENERLQLLVIPISGSDLTALK